MNSKMNVKYMIIIMVSLLLYTDGFPYDRPYDNYGRPYGEYGGNDGYYRESSYYKCFSGDSLVKLSNGQDKQIDSLNIGDEILTIDQSKLISTPIIMMLDKHISKKALFYILKTSCGNQISLTGYHLIPKISYQGNLNYTIAKQIQMGDLLVGLFNNQLKSCRVINITNQIKKGYYAPLTMEGTLLVNQILASSFAHVNNHHVAQFYMFPFRYYYKLTRFISLNDPFYLYKTEGLNWLIKIMFHFARYFRLDTLILS